MPEDAPALPENVLEALRRSGFPFQTAIADLIHTKTQWRLVESEYPWRDPSGNDQFLDLVATNGTLFATIECKKTEKETFTFLRPRGLGKTIQVDRARVLHTKQIVDATRRLETYCEDWLLSPVSFEAAFCVVATDLAGRSQRLLEGDARLLVRATEALALNRQAKFVPERDKPPAQPLLYLPIIVTNAPLFTTRYDPAEVGLASGRFENDPEIEPISWVRFRKSFTSEAGIDLGERTVFVVTAQRLAEFIDELRAAPADEFNVGSAHLPGRRL